MDEKTTQEIMADYTRDTRYENRMSKLIILVMAFVMALMVLGTVIICISNQRAMEKLAEHNSNLIVEFMSQYDFETTIDVQTDHNLLNAGNVRIER